MRTKFFTLTIFILCHGISLAENAPNSQMSRTTTAEQAAGMVREHAQSKKNYLRVNWLTSIVGMLPGNWPSMEETSTATISHWMA